MLASLLVLSTSAFAANPNVPHEHQGKLTPYTGAPPTVSLSAAELTTLQSGQIVQKQTQGSGGGRGVAVMYVNATPDVVWSKILNFGMYSKWVDGVSACTLYKVEKPNYYAQFDLSAMGVGIQYFVKHTLNKSGGYMTWTLDYSKQSDLDDVVGFWRVTPVTTDPPVTRIDYSVDIRFKGYIPGPVASYISSKGLTTAVSWVKKQSEAGH